QIAGDPTDGRTDVFALGCVWHELLTGLAPFRRPTAAGTLASTLRDPPPPLPPGVPASLADVVRRCLEKDPADRFPSAAEPAAGRLPGRPAVGREGPGTRPAVGRRLDRAGVRPGDVRLGVGGRGGRVRAGPGARPRPPPGHRPAGLPAPVPRPVRRGTRPADG